MDDDSDRIAPVIQLADYRPSPRAGDGAPAEDPRLPAFFEQVEVFRDHRAWVEGRMVEQLVALALPEVQRLRFPTPRQSLHGAWAEGKAQEGNERLAMLEAFFGSHPLSTRQQAWLDTPAFCLTSHGNHHGMYLSKEGDSGATHGSELLLLADGQLVIIEAVGWWKIVGGDWYHEHLQAIVHAELTQPDRAATLFSLQYIVMNVQDLLWDDRHAPLAPPAPDLDARRGRFLALVKALTEATVQYKLRLCETLNEAE